jgi:hypothetical protein
MNHTASHRRPTSLLVAALALALAACDSAGGASAQAVPEKGAAAKPGAQGGAACASLAVQHAKDSRGAPLWGASSDLTSGNAGKSAPGHVPTGKTVAAACRTELGPKGYALCVKDASGQVGWMHHDGFLKPSDPGGSLARITALPVCGGDACTAATCAGP